MCKATLESVKVSNEHGCFTVFIAMTPVEKRQFDEAPDQLDLTKHKNKIIYTVAGWSPTAEDVEIANMVFKQLNVATSNSPRVA